MKDVSGAFVSVWENGGGRDAFDMLGFVCKVQAVCSFEGKAPREHTKGCVGGLAMSSGVE